MSRPLRILVPGALYHLIARGNARTKVFLDERDFAALLELLGKVVARCGWLCHAYCLLDNHYHLVVETPRPNLPAGMRQLNGLYAQRFNRRHDRCGHLFQAATARSWSRRRASCSPSAATSCSTRCERESASSRAHTAGAATAQAPGLRPGSLC